MHLFFLLSSDIPDITSDSTLSNIDYPNKKNYETANKVLILPINFNQNINYFLKKSFTSDSKRAITEKFTLEGSFKLEVSWFVFVFSS